MTVKGIKERLEEDTEVLAEKTLEDGTYVKLRTWVSDVFRPGDAVYQLLLIDQSVEIKYPPPSEHHSEPEVKGLYDSIKSRADLERFIADDKKKGKRIGWLFGIPVL